MNLDSEKYEYWFAGLKYLSSTKKKKLRSYMQTAERIFNIEETQLKMLDFLTEDDREKLKHSIQQTSIDAEYKRYKEKNIQFVPYFDERYPKKLEQLADAPYALYVKGKLPDENRPAAAIVGARKCSSYGETMAIRFAEVLAESGVQIISGMARGVDGAGQRGALNVGRDSYAVLGCGVDICYPREHIGLYMDLQKNGGIISEQPPETAPIKSFFPARNRIISGLSDIVIVIEAKEKSGSLITADVALEQGKDVYALPGPINSMLSRGCHELIRQGAGILISPEDLMKELELSNISGILKESSNNYKNEKVLETTEILVYSKLDLYPKSINFLLEETKLSPETLMQKITSLVMKGFAKEISRNYYIKTVYLEEAL